MKRIFSLLGALFLGAISFGSAGVFFGYELAHVNEPTIVMRNLTNSTIALVSVETDIGESYSFTDLLPNESRRIKISGKDKSLWLTTALASGKKVKSETIYVTSGGTVFGTVSADSITIDYEL
jgi:hypothetical protein